jgi:hypothetical protein
MNLAQQRLAVALPCVALSKLLRGILLKKILLIESILVMITGIALTLFKLREGGMESVIEMAKGVENNSVVIFGLFAFLLLAIIFRLIRKNFGVSVYNFKEKMQFAEEVLEGVGSGLLGIYRLICGITVVVPFIWYFTAQESFDWTRAGVMLIFGIIFFMGLLMLSWANDESKASLKNPAKSQKKV